MPEDSGGHGQRAPALGPWSPIRRITFRFLFAYLALFLPPFFANATPWTVGLTRFWTSIWVTLVPWLAKHVLHVNGHLITSANGSTDKTYDYLRVLLFLVVAALTSLVWSLLDRKRLDYRKLEEWLRVGVRYALGSVMLGYGAVKLLKSQFAFPEPDRLLEPYGQSSPMGLLWTFMGYSTGYNIFTGIAEGLGGALLFFRRTTTFGALIVIDTMANVVALNFCYDVDVKLNSVHLLLLAVYLVTPDMKVLSDVLVLRRATEPETLHPHFTAPRVKAAAAAVKAVALCLVFYTVANGAFESWKGWGDGATRPALYGIYEVESFIRNGEETLPLLTDAARWRRIAITKDGWLMAFTMTDEQQWFEIEDDVTLKSLVLTEPRTHEASTLKYSLPSSDHLTVEGKLKDQALTVKLRRVPDSSIPLVSRGFHWISERPYNR